MQLYSNGQRTDDITDYGRSCWLYSLLKPQEWYNGRAYEGFYPTNLGNPARHPGRELQGRAHAPDPHRPLPIREDAAPAAEPGAGDRIRGGRGRTLAGGATAPRATASRNVRVLASQVTLDSALVESFNKVLLSGRSLVFSYPTMHTQVSNIPAGSTSHNVTVARAYTKLMGAFVTFKDADDALGEVMNLEYPAVNGQLESQMQLGALTYPRYPMASMAEHHHFLEIMAGAYDSKIRNMRLKPTRVRGYAVHRRVPGRARAQAPALGHLDALRRPRTLHLQELAGGPRPRKSTSTSFRTRLSRFRGAGVSVLD